MEFATLLKVTLFHEYFSCFLNCTTSIKSRKASLYKNIHFRFKLVTNGH